MPQPQTWLAAKRAMRDEDFGYQISFGAISSDSKPRHIAWKGIGKIPFVPEIVESNADDPIDAINELLEKCRKRWPVPHPWDDKSMETLIIICHNLGWASPVGGGSRGVNIERNTAVLGPKHWYVCLHGPTNFATPCECYAASPREALLGAMKEREKR